MSGFRVIGLRLGLGDTVQRGDKPGTMGDDLQALDLGKGELCRDQHIHRKFYHRGRVLWYVAVFQDYKQYLSG